jgi:hypothetical protein
VFGAVNCARQWLLCDYFQIRKRKKSYNFYSLTEEIQTVPEHEKKTGPLAQKHRHKSCLHYLVDSDIGSAAPLHTRACRSSQCAHVRSTDAQALFVPSVQVVLHRVRGKCTWTAHEASIRSEPWVRVRARKRRLDRKDASPGSGKRTGATDQHPHRLPHPLLMLLAALGLDSRLVRERCFGCRVGRAAAGTGVEGKAEA